MVGGESPGVSCAQYAGAGPSSNRELSATCLNPAMNQSIACRMLFFPSSSESTLTAAFVLSLHRDRAAVLRDGVDDGHGVRGGVEDSLAARGACRGQIWRQPLSPEACGWALLCGAVGCEETRRGHCMQEPEEKYTKDSIESVNAGAKVGRHA